MLEPGSARSVLGEPRPLLEVAQLNVPTFRQILSRHAVELCPHCLGAEWVLANGRLVPGEPGFGTLQPCRCLASRIEEEQRQRYRELSNLNAKGMLHMTFDEWDCRGEERRVAYDELLRYASAPEGWVLLRGPSGAGKTHLAVATARRHFEQGGVALFVVVADLLDHLRKTFSPRSTADLDEVFELYKAAPLLVLDEYGSHSSKPWAEEKLLQLINHRLLQALPTILTTNLDTSVLLTRISDRLSDTQFCRSFLFHERTRTGGRRNDDE